MFTELTHQKLWINRVHKTLSNNADIKIYSTGNTIDNGEMGETKFILVLILYSNKTSRLHFNGYSGQ